MTQSNDEPNEPAGEFSETTTDSSETGNESATDGESATGGSESAEERNETTDDSEPSFEATRYADGSIGYPEHGVTASGAEPVGTVDLSEHTARVVTWTTARATPPGVSAPNHLAIVAFDVDGETVRAIGQLTTDDVSIGDRVRPVYTPELRDPEAGIREADSHAWDGFRFDPVE